MGVKNQYTVADLKSFLTPQIAMILRKIGGDSKKQMDFFDMQGYCYEAAQILGQGKVTISLAVTVFRAQKMAVQVALPGNSEEIH
ncbi:MAG: hypothetical protein V8Q86_10820 [Blautia sp.]